MTTYPGSYAVPGSMWPGAAWPGDPITGSLLLEVFTGTETLIYPQYLDEQAQRTLVAAPGGTYVIELASGNPGLSVIPADGRWKPEAD
jgi:hypothetical protein